MQNPTAWLLFAVFGLLLFVMYVGIRRRWASPILVSAFGVIGSIALMALTAVAQGDTIYQAVFVGLLVGGLFSGGTLAIASYFQTAEQQRVAGAGVPVQPATYPPDED